LFTLTPALSLRERENPHSIRPPSLRERENPHSICPLSLRERVRVRVRDIKKPRRSGVFYQTAN